MGSSTSVSVLADGEHSPGIDVSPILWTVTLAQSGAGKSQGIKAISEAVEYCEASIRTMMGSVLKDVSRPVLLTKYKEIIIKESREREKDDVNPIQPLGFYNNSCELCFVLLHMLSTISHENIVQRLLCCLQQLWKPCTRRFHAPTALC